MRTLLIAVLLFPIAGSWPVSAQSAPPPRVAAVVDSIAAASLLGTGVGLSIAVMRGDSLLYSAAYGQADAELRVPATRETVFPIGSLAKQITAAAILSLAGEGRLALDDEITRHLPDYPTHGARITVRHLLDHTSGIPSYTDLGPAWSDSRALERTPEQVVALFKDRPLLFAPGERAAYNNSAYFLLGLIIERASGASYWELVRTRFAEPLGLSSLHPCHQAAVVPGRARGYTLEDGELRNAVPFSMSQAFSAGGFCMSARDLARWSAALHGGRVVAPHFYRQMTTRGTLNSGARSSFGWGLVIDELGSLPRIHHGGGIDGFRGHLAYYPEQRLTIAVLSNSDILSAERVEGRIARRLLGLQTTTRADLPVGAAERARLTGAYDLGPIRITVFERDDVLLAQGTGQPAFRLLRQSEATYLLDVPEQEIRIEFSATSPRADGLTLFQGPATMPAKRIR